MANKPSKTRFSVLGVIVETECNDVARIVAVAVAAFILAAAAALTIGALAAHRLDLSGFAKTFSRQPMLPLNRNPEQLSSPRQGRVL